MPQVTHPNLKDIKTRRHNLNITQHKLAKLTGVSQSLITKIESGKVDPTYTNAKKIFNTLDKIEKKNNIIAKDILNPDIIFADRTDKVKNIINIMQAKGISQLPVQDGNNIIGQISEKIILEKIIKGLSIKDIAETSAEEIMSDALPRVPENTPFKILSALLQHNQGILITKKENVIGIITNTDLLKGLRNKR